MSAFKALKDVSNNFEAELKRVSAELFSVRIGETFEDGISKKMRDLSLFTSKLRLLRAKPVSMTPQITEQEKSNVSTLTNYQEQATNKVLEQQIVKFLTQSHAVKALVTTTAKNLDPELADRKHKITEAMMMYRHQESQLRQLDNLLKERQAELTAAQSHWDRELGELRDLRDTADDTEELETAGPLDKKLRTLVDKMELMRWLLGKLVATRTGGYDWLADPHRRIAALSLARTPHTAQMFTES